MWERLSLKAETIEYQRSTLCSGVLQNCTVHRRLRLCVSAGEGAAADIREACDLFALKRCRQGLHAITCGCLLQRWLPCLRSASGGCLKRSAAVFSFHRSLPGGRLQSRPRTRARLIRAARVTGLPARAAKQPLSTGTMRPLVVVVALVSGLGRPVPADAGDCKEVCQSPIVSLDATAPMSDCSGRERVLSSDYTLFPFPFVQEFRLQSRTSLRSLS